jgi:methionine aminopeptidase
MQKKESDAKEMFVELIGEKAANELLSQIMEKVESGASVEEIGKLVRGALEKQGAYKAEEALPAVAAGAAIGAATGEKMSR